MANELDRFIKMVDFLGTTLTDVFDVCLFELKKPNRPVLVAHRGSDDHIDPLRNFVAEAADSKRVREKGYFTNHPVMVNMTKMLKASVFLIETAEGELVGALCLSMRCELFLRMSDCMSKMLQFNMEEIDGDEVQTEMPEKQEEPSLEMIRQVVEEFGIEPERFTQAERQEILLDLYDLGVFKLKGAVARTALELKISEQSVYRYLTKIKQARDW